MKYIYKVLENEIQVKNPSRDVDLSAINDLYLTSELHLFLGRVRGLDHERLK
jgi:hypothetical protein